MEIGQTDMLSWRRNYVITSWYAIESKNKIKNRGLIIKKVNQLVKYCRQRICWANFFVNQLLRLILCIKGKTQRKLILDLQSGVQTTIETD